MSNYRDLRDKWMNLTDKERRDIIYSKLKLDLQQYTKIPKEFKGTYSEYTESFAHVLYAAKRNNVEKEFIRLISL